jgi:hypothetical protein
MRQRKIYRQGDIVLQRIDKLPDDVDFIGFEVRIKGETGHEHVLAGKTYSTQVAVADRPRVRDFIVLDTDQVMTHDEHPSLDVPAGVYSVHRVRAYDPEEEAKQRAVED